MDFSFSKKHQEVYEIVGALGREKFTKRSAQYEVAELHAVDGDRQDRQGRAREDGGASHRVGPLSA